MMKMWRSRRAARLVFPCVFATIALTSHAQAQDAGLPTCGEVFASTTGEWDQSEQRYDDLRRGCVMAWAEQDEQREITWRFYENDFVAPVLSLSPQTGYTVTSQRPPRLLDVNQDGLRDLVTFNEIGGTNGDFDVFLYDTGRGEFAHAGTMHGNAIARDDVGAASYIVVNSKNGPHAYFRFYELADQTIRPVFDIDPQGECSVLDQTDAQRLIDADLIEFYCNIYDLTEDEDRRTPFAEFSD